MWDDKSSVVAVDAAKGLLYSSSDDNTIRVWHLERGECIATLKSSGPVYSLAWYEKQLFFSTGNIIRSAMIKPHIKLNEQQKTYFHFLGLPKETLADDSGCEAVDEQAHTTALLT